MEPIPDFDAIFATYSKRQGLLIERAVVALPDCGPHTKTRQQRLREWLAPKTPAAFREYLESMEPLTREQYLKQITDPIMTMGEVEENLRSVAHFAAGPTADRKSSERRADRITAIVHRYADSVKEPSR